MSQSEEEIIELIKKIPFFSEKKEIKEADYKELAQGFNMQRFAAGDTVFQLGDDGDQFYIILTGSVSVMVRNHQLKNWKQQRVLFQRLLDWKKEMEIKYEAQARKTIRHQHIPVD